MKFLSRSKFSLSCICISIKVFSNNELTVSLLNFYLWDRGFDSSLHTYVSQSTLHRKSWVFSGYSSFLPQGMLTGWVGNIRELTLSTVAVLRDQTWVVKWLPVAPLESLRLCPKIFHTSRNFSGENFEENHTINCIAIHNWSSSLKTHSLENNYHKKHQQKTYTICGPIYIISSVNFK
jgi:hypothetical protein